MRCRSIQQTDACVQVSLLSLCFVCSLCLCPFVLPLFRFYLLYFGILLSFFHFAFPQPVCVSLSYVSVCLSACLPLICSILSVEFTAWVLSVSLCLVACLSLWLSGCLATFYVSQFVITHNTTNWFYISVCVFLHLSLCVCVCHACALCVWVSVCVCVCVCLPVYLSTRRDSLKWFWNCSTLQSHSLLYILCETTRFRGPGFLLPPNHNESIAWGGAAKVGRGQNPRAA